MKSSIKNKIGWCVRGVIFGGIFILITCFTSFLGAVFVFFGAILLAGLILLTENLIESKDEIRN